MGFGSFLKGALPAVGGVAGFAVGGPAGAALGSGLGGALSAGLGAGQRTGGQYEAVNPNLGRDAAAQMQRGKQLQRLQLSAMGQGPSLAQMQADQSLQQGRAQLESMAASDRRNPALARRNAMIQGGMLSARIGQNAMMGRLVEQQQAEQALAASIHNAQQADNQRAQILQNAYNVRYQGSMANPTNFERASNVLASTLPMVGQLSQGSATPATQYTGDALDGYPNAWAAAQSQNVQHDPRGTWVPTGRGTGYWRP